ncbi:unnamed protein product [Cuscuta epithymum]|uniref:Leucine-rich repeat-containing N-terminal plant-type domain-containing protein n=1 Tax=Cuscuta epithymum TaxID=186058 RepID=A0AAV0FFP1_9ASTE|nr:unnamed protein product [Cuscuta epithymum]
MASTPELLLLAVVLWFVATDHHVSSREPRNDQEVMEDLMAHLQFPNNITPQSWNKNNDKCEWENVECDDSTSRVSGIHIGNLSLGGTLPDTLGNLTYLKTLEVMDNHIGGALPDFGGQLTILETLNLSNNNFTAIPPEFFSGMASLVTVSLDNNPLAPWNLSSASLTDSGNLVTFSAANCSLSGTIPGIFSGETFTNLQNLNLSLNNLTGELPRRFSSLTSLVTLQLNDQTGYGLGGTLDFLQGMTELTQVWLQNNTFSGQIPDGLSSLEDFRANMNLLTGPVPVSMAKDPLRVVNLANNLLQGPPPMFGDQVLVDSGMYTKGNNSFCSTNPGDRCGPQVDILLDIASHFRYPVVLASSWKGNNSCSLNPKWAGVTCDGGGNITALNFTHFSLSGTISPAISSLTELRNLSLANNNLTGPIPEELSGLKHLQMLDVSYNNGLCGSVPNSLANVTVSIGNANIAQDCPRSPPASTLHRNSSYSQP